MSETRFLEQLGRKLPDVPDKPEIDDDGNEFLPGFTGDVSQSPLWVTDGHIMMATNAIDPSLKIFRSLDSYRGKYATEQKIGEVWTPAQARSEIPADVIGLVSYCEREKQVALLRDSQGRVMAVNAHILAFGIRATHPDALAVSDSPLSKISGMFVTSLALRRAGELVCLIMSMKLTARDFEDLYDLNAVPIAIGDL